MKLTICFEIKHSEIYGGKDSIGYANIEYEEFESYTALSDILLNVDGKGDVYALNQRRMIAKRLDVPVEDVIIISKKEYDEQSEDNDIISEEYNIEDGMNNMSYILH